MRKFFLKPVISLLIIFSLMFFVCYISGCDVYGSSFDDASGDSHRLAAPVLSITKNRAEWTAVAGAIEYEVYEDDLLYATVTETHCNIPHTYGKTFYVKAISGDPAISDSVSNYVTCNVD